MQPQRGYCLIAPRRCIGLVGVMISTTKLMLISCMFIRWKITLNGYEYLVYFVRRAANIRLLQYSPVTGDQVVGAIEDKTGDFYRVNIGSGMPCILSRVGFEGNACGFNYRPMLDNHCVQVQQSATNLN